MLRKTYDWMMRMAEHPRAMWALGAVSFAESSFFPIPPDVMLIPMVLAERSKAWRIAMWATITSVLGGVAGYAIGYFFFEWLGKPLLAFYGYDDRFAQFASWYNDYGAWIVLFAGLTPFPYKVITIASGVTGLAFPVFLLASVLARGGRFFLVSGLLYLFGPPIRDFIEARLGLVATAFFLLLFGGFLAVKYLV